MITINKILKCFVILVASMSLSACNDLLGVRDDVTYPPIYPLDNPPPPKTNGTIYQSGHEIALYEDRISSRIGDILTVHLEEATQGEKQSKTKSNKTTSTNFTGPNLGLRNLWPQFDTTSNQDFDGKGQMNQYNKLHGTISVTVVRVLSNGNLVIQGESWVTINQGREYVQLTGIVRRDDIEANNTVSSQRIAGARVTYSGYGQVGNASRGGFLTQFLYKFFPY